MGFIDSIKSGVNKKLKAKMEERKAERNAYREEYAKHKMKMIRLKAKRDVTDKYKRKEKINISEYWFGQ